MWSPEVERAVARAGTDFLRAFDAVGCVVTQNIRVLPLTLTTITFTGKLSVQAMDIDAVKLGMLIYDELRGDGPPTGFLLAEDRPRARRARKDFHNQLPLVTPAGKAVKLFSNGKIHVTGCSSPIEFLDIVAKLCAFLPTVTRQGGAGDDAGDAITLEKFDIEMINASFLLCSRAGRHVGLRPNRLSAELKLDTVADFETERHPGVKLAVRGDDGAKVATVMIFQTGSVQICGAKRPEHVARAYAETCRRIDDIVGRLGADVCVECDAKQLRTTTSKHPFQLVDGYPTSLYNACMGA